MSHRFTELHSKNWAATCWHSWFLSCKLCSKKLNLGAWMASGCHNIQQHTATKGHLFTPTWPAKCGSRMKKGTTFSNVAAYQQQHATPGKKSWILRMTLTMTCPQPWKTLNRCGKTWGVSRVYSLFNGPFGPLSSTRNRSKLSVSESINHM